MSKVAIVFWSGTGNTEAMAELVREGVESAGGEAELIQAAEFGVEQVTEFGAFAFGCPAMGAEELEGSEFEPMWDSVEPALSGHRVALFGSYDWGTGEWMDLWLERAESAGIEVVDTVIANLAPEGAEAAACKELGASL